MNSYLYSYCSRVWMAPLILTPRLLRGQKPLINRVINVNCSGFIFFLKVNKGCCCEPQRGFSAGGGRPGRKSLSLQV